jgi:hypothetical protein
MNKSFDLSTVAINLPKFIPVGKFRITFDAVRSNAKWKVSLRDFTKGPLHIPFGLTSECQDQFQNALKKAGTDILAIKVWGEYKFYTFAGSTIAEVNHPKFERYMECQDQGIDY